jgi:hypothetical protein
MHNRRSVLALPFALQNRSQAAGHPGYTVPARQKNCPEAVMLRNVRPAILSLTLVFVAVPRFALGQANPPAGHPEPPSATSPGAPQAFLAKRAGEYTRVIKFIGQPGEWNGTSKMSVILGGRFILEETHDTVFGRPVQGMRIYGYNNATNQYEMISLYTMSTAITKMTGTSTDDGKTVEYSGISDEPRGKVPLHANVRQVDDDHFVVTLSTTGPDGTDKPFQETSYTRKK